MGNSGLVSASSSRLLSLLHLLGNRRTWSGAELATQLGVSPRTLRRDVDCLRNLGYQVETVTGPTGGYSLGTKGRVAPLLLDDEQALAVVLALQTAPTTIKGLDDALRRALTAVVQVLPAVRRLGAQNLDITTIRNVWEFSSPPIHADVLRCLGNAIRQQQRVRLDYLNAELRRPAPDDDGFLPPILIEPRHLAVWAGRWYLVAQVSDSEDWQIFRVDRIHRAEPTSQAFTPSPPPFRDVAEFVASTPDRGDTPARWQCRGTVEMAVPADVAARWAPGGSVIEPMTANRCRIILGGWSWAGIAGLLATFDADFTVVEPDELRTACHAVAQRLTRA